MAGTALRFLQHKLHSRLLHGFADFLRFMSHDHENIFRRNELLGGGDHMRQQRLAAYLMQNFRVFRL